MFRVKLWAYKHKALTYFLMFLATFFLAKFGQYNGSLWWESGVYFPEYLPYLTGGLLAIMIWFYPQGSLPDDFSQLKKILNRRSWVSATVFFLYFLTAVGHQNVELSKEYYQSEKIESTSVNIHEAVERNAFTEKNPKQLQKQNRELDGRAVKGLLVGALVSLIAGVLACVILSVTGGIAVGFVFLGTSIIAGIVLVSVALGIMSRLNKEKISQRKRSRLNRRLARIKERLAKHFA